MRQFTVLYTLRSGKMRRGYITAPTLDEAQAQFNVRPESKNGPNIWGECPYNHSVRKDTITGEVCSEDLLYKKYITKYPNKNISFVSFLGKFESCLNTCEFYSSCLSINGCCVKHIFDQVLNTLSHREEKTIRLTYGIEDIKEKSIEKIAQAIDAYSKDLVKQIQAKSLRKLRHPKCACLLKSSSMCVILFSRQETNYSKLWRSIFGEKAPLEELYQNFYAIEQRKIAEEARISEFEKEKKQKQSQIMCTTPISQCMFGKIDQIFKIDITVGELIKLNGICIFEKCCYDKTIFEEIVFVLGEHNFYFSDCNGISRFNLSLYINKIYENCSNNESFKMYKKLKTNIDELKFSVRTHNVLKRSAVETIEDLINCTEEDIKKMRNIGMESLEEIIQKLEYLGLSLKYQQ